MSSGTPANLTYTAEAYTSLREIDKQHWDAVYRGNSGLTYDFLSIVEDSGINNLEHRYLRFCTDSGEPVGKANFYSVSMDFSTMDQTLTPAVRNTIKAWYPDYLTFKVYEMGMFTMIGDCLEVAAEEHCEGVLRAAAEDMIERSASGESDFLLIRDVPLEKYPLYKKVLSPLGFFPTSGFTNAVIENTWPSFDDYLASLNSKTRHKLKTSLKIEEKFGIEIEITSDYAHLAEEMEHLWMKVNARAKDYSREQLDRHFFRVSAETLHDRSEIIVLRHEGKMVGFMFNLIGEHDYIMLDWGVDYDFELYEKTSLYRTASVLSLKRTIELGKKRLELGITNYTPKKLLGAEMRPLIFFVRHRDDADMSRTLARILLESLQHPDELAVPQGMVIAGNSTVSAVEWREYLAYEQDVFPARDPFLKADRHFQFDAMKMAGVYGFYPEFTTAQGSAIDFDGGRDVVLLGTNSYLGLNTHPRVVEAAIEATKRYGTGCSGSPLLNGTLDIHNALERELAEFTGREAAVLCSTGYQTNLTALSALCDENTLVLMDERNHRSLFDGVRLSGAEYAIYRHNDPEHLARILGRNSDRSCLVVTDSVFSMEGTVADLPRLCDIKERYGARLYVDESHAFGAVGEGGRGLCEQAGVLERVDLVMGTFSKSFAALGGFVAGERRVIEFIKHTGGGHIFSASLPPAVVATVRECLRIVRDEPERRQELLAKAHYVAHRLVEMGYQADFCGVPIVPVVFGHSALALAAYCKFMAEGVYVNPVLPPAVPENQAGFRTSYMANHDWRDIERALAVFERLRGDFAIDEERPDENDARLAEYA
ncbi:aminotransferase class I/II-fold pyridoxal phosphate-dependent enzyme [Microbulbifer rhizosphaerae]|uniref:8-amino-7-oxononanoate synthase n=1 Tax=Microbulbifer rhizosphaerae TaxID=1562603 RepID=A0A7W4Z9Q3_9GAMM|nr:aminotransferase class I/II-fold pyridoxal phosphate-dependent enzyme [Microbulbifer rhizosphaerae]MBB3061932.1 8-amino-7-oxononanoate synthase [Microbulbifer rhizosphaerae]